MLTDIEIAAQAKMKRITDVAAAMGIHPEELEPYGHYKAKLSDDLLTRLQDRPDGKLVLVSVPSATIQQMRQLMLALGCVDAFNVDGGASCGMYYNGTYLSKPGRELTVTLQVFVSP